MIEISNNGIIEITRGDYAEIPLFVNQGDKPHPVRYSLFKDPGASIQFGIMKPGQLFERAEVKKVYTVHSRHTSKNDIIISILPEDTLKLQPGQYYYAVKLIRPESGHYCTKTIIPDRLFIVR